MEHPIGKRDRGDLAPLGIPDREAPELPGRRPLRADVFGQRRDPAIEIGQEPGYPRIPALAAGGLPDREQQIVRRCDLAEGHCIAPHRLHFPSTVAGWACTTAATPAPYRSIRDTPMPSISPSAAGLETRRRAISASCSLVSTA